MRILDTIFKEAERQGFEVGTLTNYTHDNTFIQVGKEKVYFSVMEEGKQKKTKLIEPTYNWERQRYEYDRYTTGRLKLNISTRGPGYSSMTISDTKTKTIEKRLDEVFHLLLQFAEESKKHRLESEEKERKDEIAREIREQQEREYEAEMTNREQLEEQATLFTNSAYIYQYIQEVENQVNDRIFNPDQLQKFRDWKKWALEHADRLNPVKQMLETLLKEDDPGSQHLTIYEK